ncbi:MULTISPECIES: NTP transferase domain-containing protein [unclassified Microbacterium]|uniref:NTP transferase domain-containing protein n=1 Tax=unclassified Microbacterium TaxID=2609290 RepID=UPI001604AEF1|nr:MULTISPECIES: NTP transferase domain-containing protein [unclassified Microbacterium]QNA91332.1 NTP transferase domain-containing protein [Microbacterium sp. Se63.02b]QYM64491.1 NTP transferase domain-containing protein [Microbacterium sp. Se5.02b]
MKVIVLAGGQGRRLTTALPGHKALAQLAGRPLISHVLDEVGESADMESYVVVPVGLRAEFVASGAVQGAHVVETSATTPTGAIVPLIEHGDLVVLVHADEICVGSPAVVYAHAVGRAGAPVVGVTAGKVDRETRLTVRSTASVEVAEDGRLDDGFTSKPRYIGRFAVQVDDALLDALPRYPSILQALLSGRESIAELTLPKRYFDCGSDALLDASQSRFEGAL